MLLLIVFSINDPELRIIKKILIIFVGRMSPKRIVLFLELLHHKWVSTFQNTIQNNNVQSALDCLVNYQLDYRVSSIGNSMYSVTHKKSSERNSYIGEVITVAEYGIK